MASAGKSKISPPKGTRDLYPHDLLRQRYITEAWRRVSIRHGFDEIAGPTFEMRELYTRKSGEGIVSELFSFRREGGRDDYALRPEFTPTLARMYAAKANSLPTPCKWFTAGPYFRAERPQRGRLREFVQWNCDVLGGEGEASRCLFDLETISVIITMLDGLGFGPESLRFRVSDRQMVSGFIEQAGVSAENMAGALTLLDKRNRLSPESVEEQAKKLSFNISMFDDLCRNAPASDGAPDAVSRAIETDRRWMTTDYSIVRGLAYYTGTVFELIADGERAVAGGGRYDNLIELFGGPATPAVGFGMGDVVLGLLLEDKNLMPEGRELAEALSLLPASLRPEAFVVSADEQRGDPLVEPLLADLRRGIVNASWKDRGGKPWDADRYEISPMHARRSYKSTRNLKKLLNDAEKQWARFAVVIHDADKVQLKDLDRREELTHDSRGDFSVDPVSDAYVGRAIAARL
ncbi:MAG TPA: hypothetical protein ENJ00_02715 [Phycisphaerales bacterium]|nr:hypothetical protein [Phycisphaerales bacterium]